MGRVDYYLHEDGIFKDICVVESEISNMYNIKIVYAINGCDYIKDYVVSKERCRPLEDWEIVKYKLLGFIK